MEFSILIPVFNYDVRALIENLLFQLKGIDCSYEIVLSDDNSNSYFRNTNNEYIKNLNNDRVKLIQQSSNIGNGVNRNCLIKNASYEWLLFLDADVFPVFSTFISVYIAEMRSTLKEIISGNIVYELHSESKHLLRWKYGVKKEQISFKERKKRSIISLRGANFAIKKDLAVKNNFLHLIEDYGFVDTRFFLQFKQYQVSVVENPVYHLGIESNEVYFEKMKKSIRNALFMFHENNEVVVASISIISNYKKVRLLKNILGLLYEISNKKLKKNIVSSAPSIFVFQMYKLLYIAYLDSSKDF